MLIDYLVHELFEFTAVHEQPKFMNKVRLYEQFDERSKIFVHEHS